jgi:hypothetical protein
VCDIAMMLGEILVQLRLLTARDLALVLDERNLLGGRLGTQLVERGLVDTEQVTDALSRQMRVPAALQRHFDHADPAIVALLKPNLAARYMAIPLVAARSGNKRIVVAMATPKDDLIVDEVAFAIGARVEPMVAAELAIARNLKRFYNMDVKLARPARPEPPRGSASSRELPVLGTEPVSARHATLSYFAHDEPPTTPAPNLPPSIGAAVSLDDVLGRIATADQREHVGSSLVDFMLTRFECGLVFLIRGPNAHVWRGFAPGVEARALQTITFPLSMPSVFSTTKDRREIFRGRLPTDANHLHVQIWKYLGAQPPAEALIIPVAIGERVVSLVYAHAQSPLGDDTVADLKAVCTAVGEAFVRLIQAAKDGTAPPTLLPR